MHNNFEKESYPLNIIDSILSVKASGNELENSVAHDLQLPEGKSIAQLLYDQKKSENNQENQ